MPISLYLITTGRKRRICGKSNMRRPAGTGGLHKSIDGHLTFNHLDYFKRHYGEKIKKVHVFISGSNSA
jgi:hypothetical protein